MAQTFSGRRVASVLIRVFGFREAGQKGSHLKLKKKGIEGEVVAIVPLHRELATGTLHGVLGLAGVEYKEFLKAARK